MIAITSLIDERDPSRRGGVTLVEITASPESHADCVEVLGTDVRELRGPPLRSARRGQFDALRPAAAVQRKLGRDRRSVHLRD